MKYSAHRPFGKAKAWNECKSVEQGLYQRSDYRGVVADTYTHSKSCLLASVVIDLRLLKSAIYWASLHTFMQSQSTRLGWNDILALFRCFPTGEPYYHKHSLKPPCARFAQITLKMKSHRAWTLRPSRYLDLGYRHRCTTSSCSVSQNMHQIG